MAIRIGEKTTHVGLVIEVIPYAHTFNDGYDYSSDAIVWNFETMTPEHISYYCTMPGSTNNGTAEVDASDLAKECYKIYQHNRRMHCIASNESNEFRAFIGDTVKVVKGRKCPIGIVGEVVEAKPTQYGTRYKIRDSKHEYIVWNGNYEIIARPLTAKPRELQPYMAYPKLAKVLG